MLVLYPRDFSLKKAVYSYWLARKGDEIIVQLDLYVIFFSVDSLMARAYNARIYELFFLGRFLLLVFFIFVSCASNKIEASIGLRRREPSWIY